MALKRIFEYLPEFKAGFILPTGAGANKILFSNGSGEAEWGNAKIRTYHTYLVKGEVKAESLPLFWASLAEGEKEIALVKARYKIREGTKAVLEIKRNGSAATGFTALEATTSAAQVTPTAIKLSENDELEPVITEVSGTPKYLSFEMIIEHTI